MIFAGGEKARAINPLAKEDGLSESKLEAFGRTQARTNRGSALSARRGPDHLLIKVVDFFLMLELAESGAEGQPSEGEIRVHVFEGNHIVCISSRKQPYHELNQRRTIVCV